MPKFKMVPPVAPDEANDFHTGLQTEQDVIRFFIKSKEGRELANKFIEEYEELIERFKLSREAAEEADRREQIILAKLQEKDPGEDHPLPEKPFSEIERERQKIAENNLPPKDTETLKLDTYNDILSEANKNMAALNQRHQDVDKQYDANEQMIEAADKIDTSEALREQIASARDALKKETDRHLDRYNDGLMSDEDYLEARRITNAKYAYIQHAENKLNLKEGKTVMFDEDGNSVTDIEKAAYHVDADKKLFKDGKDMYLLDKDADFDKLSDDEKVNGKRQFLLHREDMQDARYANKDRRDLDHVILGQLFEREMASMQAKLDKLPDRQINLGVQRQSSLAMSTDTQTDMLDVDKFNKVDYGTSSEKSTFGATPAKREELEEGQQQTVRAR